MKNSLGLGAATLIMIFALLSLTVFAVLSLSSARANLSLSERYASSVSEYYAADARAAESFARIRESYDEDVSLGYSVPVGDELKLSVLVERENGEWRVLRWAVEDASDWSPDETIKVWDGE